MTIEIALPADAVDLAEFERLETRLIAEFSPPLRPEEVQRCLLGCIANYQSATVHHYLPLLIEREARDQLSTAVSDARRLLRSSPTLEIGA